jgi:hypothetical protein
LAVLRIIAITPNPRLLGLEEARWATVGNTLMSRPHSAIRISAIRTPTPGIVHRSSISSAYGAVAIPILASMFPIAWSSASMWASSPATRTPWWLISNLLASAS